MKRDDVNRRNFNQAAIAAFGGMVAGTMSACNRSASPPTTTDNEDVKAADTQETTNEKSATLATNDWTGDVHVCRGLNACMNKGAGGDNACAGQGSCATAKAHLCHAMNDCKFQGGCGESVGTNDCQGKGECAVPLNETAWTAARERFEAAMQQGGTEFGTAPAPQG